MIADFVTAEPSFPGGGIKDLRLKVGETIKYDVAITGEPLPEVAWSVDGKPLKAIGRVKMSTERGKTKLKVSLSCDPLPSSVIRTCLDRKRRTGRLRAVHHCAEEHEWHSRKHRQGNCGRQTYASKGSAGRH